MLKGKIMVRFSIILPFFEVNRDFYQRGEKDLAFKHKKVQEMLQKFILAKN